MKKRLAIIIGILILIILSIWIYFVFNHSLYNHTKSSYSAGLNNGSVNKSSLSINNSIVKTMYNPRVGSYLASPSGRALYVYAADKSGISKCSGTCMAIWPAYQDKGSRLNLPVYFSTIIRKDNNEVQFTFKGKPLYFFSGDKKGQVKGNGVTGFSIARP